MAKESSTGTMNGITIVVAGDPGTGKSSLISTAMSGNFLSNVPPVFPPCRLPDDMFPDRVPVTIIDTSSSVEQINQVGEELKRADAVVLTYACDRPETLVRLSTYWLPELHRLEVKVPIIVAGCKVDLMDEQQRGSLELVMSQNVPQFRKIDTCRECSALKHIQIREVFYYAQKSVLHPIALLFNQERQALRHECVKALTRIFILCDHDKDGALSDAELNDFQFKCFNGPLQPSEIVNVKRVVQEKLPEGVNKRGLTLRGFLFLQALFIENRRQETTWNVLRKFGYNNDNILYDEFLPPSCKRVPDQSVELTTDAVDGLKGIFSMYDINNSQSKRGGGLTNEERVGIIKGIASEEFGFFKKLQERLADPDDYIRFLKWFGKYSKGIITRQEFQSLVHDTLGNYPDLMNEFDEFLTGLKRTEENLGRYMS